MPAASPRRLTGADTDEISVLAKVAVWAGDAERALAERIVAGSAGCAKAAPTTSLPEALGAARARAPTFGAPAIGGYEVTAYLARGDATMADWIALGEALSRAGRHDESARLLEEALVAAVPGSDARRGFARRHL